jgi:hypothetical protein
MLAATLAKLLHLQPVRGGLPVFGLGVIAFLAVTALYGNDLSGHTKKLLTPRPSA